MTVKNLVLIATLALVVTPTRAQKNEFAVSVGGMFTSATTPKCNDPCFQLPRFEVKTAPALAFQGTFARRIEDFHAATLYFELPLLGIPGREPSSATGVPVNYSSIFVPPSLKVKLSQGRAISPFFSLGGGFAYLNGHNSGRNFTGSGQFGGGADFKTRIPFLAISGEVRDFFSGRAAAENLVAGSTSDSRQHNLFTGGGAVLSF